MSSITKFVQNLEPKETEFRKALQNTTNNKVKFAQKLNKYAQFFPTIRLIALTGSVSVNNSKPSDDIDLMIVTYPNTLWITRPFFLIFLSLVFNRRHPGDNPAKVNNHFCPNLWLDTDSLSVPQSRRNIYTAHEVLQVKPIFDRGHAYLDFLHSNQWTKHFLANAYSRLTQDISKNTRQNTKKSLLFVPLNFLMFILQYLFMLPKKTTELVSLHSAFFHKNDLSGKLERLLK